MMLLFIPFPIKAKYLVSAYGLYEIYSTLKPSAGDNVAHVAHLGGMLFAFIMIMMWRKDRQNFY
jgi:membrane associated rhomboid family serine protease